MEIARQNANTTFDLARQAVEAKSLPELLELTVVGRLMPSHTGGTAAGCLSVSRASRCPTGWVPIPPSYQWWKPNLAVSSPAGRAGRRRIGWRKAPRLGKLFKAFVGTDAGAGGGRVS